MGLCPLAPLGSPYSQRIIVKESQIVLHETDEPDAVGDLPDPDMLAREDGAEVDLTAADADSATTGDQDGTVVERILGRLWLGVGAGGRCLHLSGVVAAEGLVRCIPR